MAVAIAPAPAAVRTLNDRLRQRHAGGEVVVTVGLQMLGPTMVAKVVAAVAAFDAFTPGGDPYGEHDFGAIVVDGHQVFFKIDAYDVDYRGLSLDLSDPAVACRVMTVMLAEEY